MASQLFNLAAKRLEQRTDLDLLEARGTLRLALEKSGVEPKTLTLRQLEVVFQTVIPKELELRGIRNVEAICNTVMRWVLRTSDMIESTPAETPEETFRRLGGS